MDRFVKINSVQAGDFTATNNLIDFTIPAGDMVNLKDSYLNFNIKINVEETSTDGGVGVYPMDLQWKTASTDKPRFTNGALIKNCSVKSDLKGQIENIRRSDQYQQIVATYTKSQREAYATSYLAANQLIRPVNRNQFTLFREINKTGTDPSRDLDICPVQISLADLFDFCNVATELDTTKTGHLRFHMEMNIDKLEAVQRMVAPATDWANTGLEDMLPVSGAGGAGDKTSVTTLQKYTSLDLSPYYVGQAVTINGTGGGAPTDKRVVISSITWDTANDGQLIIGFTEKWATLGGSDTVSDIKLTPIAFSSASVELNFAEVVYKVLGAREGRGSVGQLQFNTLATEQTNGNSLTSFQNQFEIEPSCTNVILSFPSGQDDLVSSGTEVDSYRLRLNNQDLFDRDIEPVSPLYYDRLAMTWSNMNYRLKNLWENSGSTSEKTWDDVYDRTDNDTIILANPLFQTDRTKYLQVNIEASSGGVKKITIFKQVPRTLEL